MQESKKTNGSQQLTDPIAIGESMQAVLDELGYSQQELAKVLGRNRKTISRYLKMARWPNSIKVSIRSQRELLGARFIWRLSARSLNEQQLQQEIEHRIQQWHAAVNAAKVSLPERLRNYFADQNLSNTQRELISKALKELKIL